MKMRLLILCVIVAAGFALPGTVGCGQTASGGGPEVSLPPPTTAGGMGVAEAIAKRRSVRQFTQEALTMEEVSQLAWAAQGITEPEKGLRAAPSAGALYPLELYLFTKDGVFHYLPKGHKLVQLSAKDKRGELSAAALGQSCVRQAALAFAVTGVFGRTEAKYGKRSSQYVYMEAGHAAQNIHLQAVALGLGSVPVGALQEKAVADILGLSSEETPLYIIPVGHPR
jgi:SagB-type dehydrogenase family enzyme